jgi:hypothetical protein
MGPSSPFTIPPKSSALINEMQQTRPSFSQLTSANLSPARMFALSLISFGSTIWPRSSTLTNDSTLQPLGAPPVVPKQAPVFVLFVMVFSSDNLIFLNNQIYLIYQTN